MRRLTLFTALALTAMATPVTAAFAETPEPPHRSAAADWTGIDVLERHANGTGTSCSQAQADCDFTDAAQRLVKGHIFGVSYSIDCNVTITGDIDGAGHVGVSNTTSSNCAVDDYGEGDVCQHLRTGEYWLRLEISIPGAGAVPTFAQVLADPSGLATSVPTSYLRGAMYGNSATGAFADAYYTNGGLWNIYHQATFDLWGASKILAGKSESSAACDWPELS